MGTKRETLASIKDYSLPSSVDRLMFLIRQMTKEAGSCNDPSRQASAPAGVGEECVQREIRITPEMIEAGVLPLYRYHPETGASDEETVSEIFLAMYRYRPLP